MYKIIQNNTIIDVVQYPRFVSFLASGHIAITDKTSASGIVGSDNKTIYSFKTLQGYQTVSIEEITPNEFKRLSSLLNSNQEINLDNSILATLKREAIKRLSANCKNNITAGFSIILSDNELYNFKLTVEDQLNLMMLENQLANGEKSFIYHATDKPCKIFLREDMTRIIKAFRAHVLYHTTYFNVAKQYIKTLADIEKIKFFSYGTDISEYAENETIKQILKNGGNFN